MGSVFSITTGELMITDEKKDVLRRELFWCAVALAVFAAVYLLMEDRPTRTVTAVPAPKPNGKAGKQVPVAPAAVPDLIPELAPT